MLRLPAKLGSPYRIAVAAASDDGTLAGTLTEPDGTDTALALVADGAVWVHRPGGAEWTPDQLGVHTVTLTASDDSALVGLAMEILVGTLSPGDLVVDHTVTDPACGHARAVRWPCPTLRRLQCIDEFPPEAVREWMGTATQTVFTDTAARFPGCHWYARIRPRVTAACLLATPTGRLGFDLFPAVRYPVLELLEVTEDGTAHDLTDWSVEGRRWLVPADGVSWPLQDWAADPGAEGTWSVLVRYGRAPEPLAVTARDLMAYSLIISTEPTTGGTLPCRLPDGTTQVSENGRVITMDPDAAAGAVHEQILKRWPARAWDFTQLVDPAEPTARASSFHRLVPGDQTPLSHATFLNSGCDLAAELEALSP